jgi:protein-S-isoprenylcysteine O-methyltransferase Ste14
MNEKKFNKQKGYKMNENIFRVLSALILFSVLGISAYFRRKADRDSGEKVSVKDEGLLMTLTLRIGGLTLWFSALAYLINPAWMAWAKIGLPDWARWLAVGLGITCAGLLYWMFSNIGQGITVTVATRKNHQLVTSGPYRYIRNPLYTFGTTFFLAFALMTDNWFIAGMAVLALIALAIRLPNEEAHLIAKFGDEYRAYMKQTGRFLPKIL